MVNGQLYKCSYSGPLLRCVHSKEALRVLAEIHEGHCGNHSRERSWAHKAQLQGFYWPMMRADT